MKMILIDQCLTKKTNIIYNVTLYSYGRHIYKCTKVNVFIKTSNSYLFVDIRTCVYVYV